MEVVRFGITRPSGKGGPGHGSRRVVWRGFSLTGTLALLHRFERATIPRHVPHPREPLGARPPPTPVHDNDTPPSVPVGNALLTDPPPPSTPASPRWAAMGVKPGQNSRPRSSSPGVLERTYVVAVGGTSHGWESRRSTRSRCLATGPAATSERDHPPVRVACSMQHPETGEFRRPPQSSYTYPTESPAQTEAL